MPRRAFITVAEVSGDLHASHLIRSLRQIDPTIHIEGLGGPNMRQAGAVIHHETTTRATMGLQSLRRIREVWNLLGWTKKHFAQQPFDLQICVDSPAMNFHFARLAHSAGTPVLYYIAPQLWAWREGRMKKLRKWVDHVACILPFEELYFQRHGVRATFVGHPLFDELSDKRPPSDGPRFPQADPVIGLLPGSRAGEARANYPHLLDVATRIRHAFPNAKFLVPTTPATHPVVNELSAGFQGLVYQQDAFNELVPRCDLCLTVSGTATLHVAGHGVPMIVVYRGNPLLWHGLGRWLVRTRTYSLVNLLNDSHDHIVPEFIPWYGSNAPVAERAIEYLRNPEQLTAQKQRLQRLILALDKPGASMNVARLAVGMMDQPTVTTTAPSP